MQLSKSLFVAALTLPLFALAAPHDHGAAAPHQLELNAGKKWPTDDALRKGMTAIRTSVATALPAAHAGQLTPAQYDALGQDISARIAYIVQNCKLDPKADAQLHGIIAEISNGVDTMAGKQPGQERAQGVVQVAQALNAYGTHFNHAGWQAIKLSH